MSERGDITDLLVRWRGGEAQALERLMPIVYGELHALARRYMRGERPGHTLQSTALVHEAFLRLADARAIDWQNRAHFFGVASTMIRNILVDHARAHRAEKRGGDTPRLALDHALNVAGQHDVDLLALDQALIQLQREDAQLCRLVELRFFGGLTIEETAHVLQLSDSTVKRQWLLAKTWIFRQLTG